MTEEKPAEAESDDVESKRWAAENLAAKNAITAAIPISILTDDPEILAEFEKKGNLEMSDVNPFELSEPPVAQAPAPAPSPNNGRRKHAEAAEPQDEAPVKPRRGGRPKGSKNKTTLNTEGQPPQPAPRRGRPPRAAAPGPIVSRGAAPAALMPVATATQDVKISLATAMDALFYLKEEDRALTSKFVQVLSNINKGSRERILAAVGKVFA